MRMDRDIPDGAPAPIDGSGDAEQACRRLIARISQRASTGLRIIAVDGPSGSGKTSFADALHGILQDVAPVVHMDDIYPGWDGLAQAPGLVREWILEPLAAGREGRFRRWDWINHRRAEEIVVPRREWIIIEGVASGARSAAPYLSGLAWITAEPQTRMRRGIERDGEAYRPHWEAWATQEASHFAIDQTPNRADLIRRT